MTKKLLRIAASVLCMTSSVVLAADPTYAVKELTQFTRATSINNLGDIVGWQIPAQGILLRSGQTSVQTIPSLGGPATYPRAINDYGHVVGESMLSDNVTYHAFLYANGVTSDLGTLPGYKESGATDINLKGQVVGWLKSGSVPVRLPFFYSGGRMTAMQVDSSLYGVRDALATAINDRGKAVGNVEAKEGDNDPPYVWGPFSYSSGSLLIGGSGFGGHSRLWLDINANGLIVGSSELTLDSRTRHAAAWFDGWLRPPTDLGVLPGYGNSVAAGVNRNAQIVGYSHAASDGPESRRAFIYFSGWMFDLNERLESSAKERWLIREAIAINDSGQIIAEGCERATTRCPVAILLTPITTTTSKPPRRR